MNHVLIRFFLTAVIFLVVLAYVFIADVVEYVLLSHVLYQLYGCLSTSLPKRYTCFYLSINASLTILCIVCLQINSDHAVKK